MYIQNRVPWPNLKVIPFIAYYQLTQKTIFTGFQRFKDILVWNDITNIQTYLYHLPETTDELHTWKPETPTILRTLCLWTIKYCYIYPCILVSQFGMIYFVRINEYSSMFIKCLSLNSSAIDRSVTVHVHIPISKKKDISSLPVCCLTLS